MLITICETAVRPKIVLTMGFLLDLLYICLFSLSNVSAFPNGAPEQACDTLSPDPLSHGAEPSNCSEPCPFFLESFDLLGVFASNDTSQYYCDVLYTIYLGSSGPEFRGFFVQSRESTSQFTANAPFAGEFVNIFNDAEWQIRPCNGSNAGATHRSNDADSGVSLIWRAPSRQSNPPSVTFWLTIVQERTLYYVQIEGLILTPNEASCVPVDVVIGVSNQALNVSESDGQVSVCVTLISTGQLPILSDVVTFQITTIDISTSDDYNSVDEQRTFLPGTPVGTEQCFNITIVDDVMEESDESFLVILTSSDADINEDVAVVIILDDDEDVPVPVPEPSGPIQVGLSEGNASVREGESVLCCVEILSGVAETLHVILVATISDTAVSGQDFESVLQNVKFDVGSRAGYTQCVHVNIISDGEAEGPEEFIFFIFVISFSSQQIQIVPERMIKIVTIIDVINIFIGFEPVNIQVGEGDGVAMVCVELRSDRPTSQEEAVNIYSSDFTAVSCDAEPIDYVPLSASLVFPARSPSGTQQCVCATILEDSVLEGTEQFNITLVSSSPNVMIDNDMAIVSIIDTESTLLFGFALTNTTVLESEGPVDVCVTLLSPVSFTTPVTLQLAFEDGRATAPDDYTAAPVTITVPANAMMECVAVDIVDDGVAERTESFNVILQAGSNPDVEVDRLGFLHTVFIEDDDGAIFRLGESSTTVSEDAGEVLACVELQAPPVLMNESSYVLFTMDGSARDGRDYRAQTRVCRFPVGSLAGDSQCLSIPIIDNDIPDGDRQFGVRLITLDQSVEISPGGDLLTVTITDNDAPQLRFERSEYTVTEDSGTLEVCVQLVGGPLTFNAFAQVDSVNGDAIDSEDFSPVQDSVIFLTGSVDGDTQCVGVGIIDDSIVETSQSFTLSLTSQNTNITVGGDVTTITITDNDVTSAITVGFKDDSISVREDSSQLAMICIQICPGINETQQMTRRKRSIPGEQSARIGISTTQGSASEGEDYIPVNTEVLVTSLPSLKTQTCSAVGVVDDDALEGDERLTASLDDFGGGGWDIVLIQGAESLSVLIEDNEVPAVGFRVVETTCGEATSRVFACVEIFFPETPLEVEVEVEFYTQDGSATAPDDYETLVTTLTFREGAVRSFSFDAECVAVFVFDDVVPEETESLSFHLRSLNTSSVRIMQGRETQQVFIVDNDVVSVLMATPSYSVMENVGQDELGLMVCATVVEADFDFTVLLIPEDDSAIEGVDYRLGPGRMDFFDVPGNQTRCVCVQIMDDSCFRGNRTFNLFLFCDKDSVTTPTTPVPVTIMDNEENNTDLRWINDSPRVTGDSVSADLFIGSGICSATCSITGQQPQDCLSGSVVFTDLEDPPTGEPLTFTVAGTLFTGVTVVLTREFRIGNNSVCSAHLINDGVTTTSDTVEIEWQGTGPSATNQNTQFLCSLDGGNFESCTSLDGYTQTNLPPGTHEVVIRPAALSQCTGAIDLIVTFNI